MRWVLGVVGVVLLGVLVDVLLPKGQMSKYVKAIFAVLLIFVILNPVAAFLRQQTPLSSLVDFEIDGYQTDTDYIQIVDDTSLLAAVRARYPTVYSVLRTSDGGLAVYVEGTPPSGLADYAAILGGVESGEVRVYGQE